MTRFHASQPDLFTPPPAPTKPAARTDPLAELTALLAKARAADRPYWPDLTAAMEEEYLALHLGRLAGPEGKALASAFSDEAERLLAMTD